MFQNNKTKTIENIKEYFEKFLRERQQKMTSQRNLILDEFLTSKQHLSTEELHRVITQKDDTISHSTVYRMLKLMCVAGLAREEDFGDGVKRYEYEGQHHDHLICVSCNKTVEVFDTTIESIQEKLAESNGYLLTGHKMDIYGICADCRNKEALLSLDENAQTQSAVSSSSVPTDGESRIGAGTVRNIGDAGVSGAIANDTGVSDTGVSETRYVKSMPLGLLKTGGKAVIASFAAHRTSRGNVAHQRKDRRIQTMGIRVGKTVEVLNNEGKGPILLKIDDLRIAIGRAIAMEIMVQASD
ncbi:MAG: transcriptional repressor [Nitrospirae bacterium]|nr:transcriptional repressor [Nitrospirota bacterium]